MGLVAWNKMYCIVLLLINITYSVIFAILSPSSFSSSATLRARWTELNQNRPHARNWLRFEIVCPKFGVSPSPKIGGPKTTPFDDFRNLTATLTAYIFGTKNDIRNRESAIIRDLSPTSSQNVLNFGSQTDSVNSAFCFIARLRRRRSANGAQPNFAKRWTVNRANNLT